MLLQTTGVQLGGCRADKRHELYVTQCIIIGYFKFSIKPRTRATASVAAFDEENMSTHITSSMSTPASMSIPEDAEPACKKTVLIVVGGLFMASGLGMLITGWVLRKKNKDTGFAFSIGGAFVGLGLIFLLVGIFKRACHTPQASGAPSPVPVPALAATMYK